MILVWCGSAAADRERLLLPPRAHGTDGKGYVVGDGAIQTIPVADRGDADRTCPGEDLDGKPISLASLRGKPTVVNVWGPGAPPATTRRPSWWPRREQLGGKANFVGIDVRDTGTAAGQGATAQRFGIDWPSFFSPGGEALLAFPGVISRHLHPVDRGPRRPGTGRGQHHRRRARPA